MNILQILPELSSGGVETGTVDFALWLKGHGHKSVVVSGGGQLAGELERENIKHFKFPVHKKSLRSVLSCARRLEKIITEEDIRIVHARSRVPALIAALAVRRVAASAAAAAGPVLITTCHGYYSRHIFSRPMGWGRFVIAASHIIARHMIEDFGVPFDRVRLIPRGVNLKRFNFIPPSEKPGINRAVGIIGRLVPGKGHTTFIKAVSIVTRVIPKVRVFIVGEAPESGKDYKRRLELLINRLGLEKYAEFTGHRDDIPRIMSQLDVLVLASVYPEAFGRVIIEAQACGVPVVATKVGGVTDIIQHEKNGLLVQQSDHRMMAEAVIKILRDVKLSERLAQQARTDVYDKFDLERMALRTLQVYEEALKSAKILLIKLGAPGDIVLAVPSLRAVKQKLAGAHVSVLTGLEGRHILQNCPYVDELIIYNKEAVKKSLPGFFRLAGRLRERDFNMAIDLQNNARSHLLGFLSLAPKRVGYDNNKLGFLLNRKVKPPKKPIGPISHQFVVLKAAGIEAEDESLELWPQEPDYEFADGLLQRHWVGRRQSLVGINIGGGARWRTKVWPWRKVARLCDELANLNIRAVLTGTEAEADTAKKILSAASSAPIDAAGKTTLNQLAALITKCKVFVSGDSAPIHIAAAMKTPFIGLFGPTDPRRHLPPADKITIIRKNVKCSPCYRHNCRNARCMKQISVNEVLSAIEGWLAKPVIAQNTRDEG